MEEGKPPNHAPVHHAPVAVEALSNEIGAEIQRRDAAC
jgi:hypothetical protein